MPKIVTPNGSPALATATGAHDYVLAGLEITVVPNVYTWGMLQLGNGTETAAADVPYNLIVERCFIHGDPKVGGKRGIGLNSRASIVRQSWISDFKSTYQDAQAIMGFNGVGPFEITDNHLEASGENIMFGGSTAALLNAIPSDITIRRNTLFKPLSWRPGTPGYAGVNWLVKNHFELKAGRRVVFEGNTLENCWQSGQNGSSIVLTVSTEGGRMPWGAVEDVTIANNIIRHVGVGITGHSRDPSGGGIERNLKFRNNLFEDIDHVKWGGTGTFMSMSGSVPGIVIEHNTILTTRFTIFFGYTPSVGTVFQNNITSAPICADGLGCAGLVTSRLGLPSLVTGNVMIGPSYLPVGNLFAADINAVRFDDPSNSKYALAYDSIFVGKALDGADPGVNMNALQAALTGTGTPVPPPPPPPPPPAIPPPAPAPGTASFVRTDTATAGSWKGVYGTEGFNIFNHAVNYPAYATVTPSGATAFTWAASTTDARALQKSPANASDRFASCLYSDTSFNVAVAFNDGRTHRVALYLVDWDRLARGERVEVLDSSNNVLDSRTLTSLGGGQYVVWTVSGRVTIRVTKTAGTNAVVSGIFFDDPAMAPASAPGASAAFVRLDTATAGSWKGVFGADGFNIIGNGANYPAYVTVTPTGNSAYVWSGSTSDPRGLQKATATDRFAGCWYAGASMNIDLAFNDGATHQVALYVVDWDRANRAEKIEVVDSSNRVLDTRSVSGFGGGQYVVWNLRGRVTIRVTRTNGDNAVVSGLFFR